MDEELVASESELRSLERQDAEEAAKTPDSHETATCRQNKLKLLVRSHAIREAASPPPDPSRAAEKPVEPTDETSSVQSEAPGERLEVTVIVVNKNISEFLKTDLFGRMSASTSRRQRRRRKRARLRCRTKRLTPTTPAST